MDTFNLNWNIDENGILIREDRVVEIPVEIIQEKCRTFVPSAENDIGIMINDPNNPNSNILLTFREFRNICDYHMQRSDHQGRRLSRFTPNSEGQRIEHIVRLTYTINRGESKFGSKIGGKKQNQSKKIKYKKKNSRRFLKNINKTRKYKHK
jgi:hypothetical protein